MAELKAQPRTVLGKHVKDLREKGFLPGVVYGSKGEAKSIAVLHSDFLRIWKSAGESTFIDLAIEGDGSKHVLIHDVSFHPVRNVPVHVDFYEARADRKMRIHVPLSFIGESEAIKAQGGVLFKGIHEIEIEAMPKDLPHEITVDISTLKTFDDVISAKDLVLPKGVELYSEPELVIANVTAPRSDAEIAALNETADVSLDTIEVVQKGKKEEDATGEEESSE